MTGFVKKLAGRLAGRLGALSGRRRLLAAGLAALVLAGAFWLVVADRPGRMSPPTAAPLTGPAAGGAAAEFQRLAGEDNMWQTQAQSQRRWQAAKMAALGRLIAGMPQVASATVLFEPGAPRRLGSGGEQPTAAVKVCLADGVRMTYGLAAAIADLVAGSIAGMDRPQVRIVDNTGRSYRVGEQTAAAAERFSQQTMVEAYYAEKVRAALAYIEHVTVCVQTAPGEPGLPVAAVRRTASVSLPRSHFVLIGRRRLGRPPRPEQTDALIEAESARIRQVVARVIGTTVPGDVHVGWHYDASAAPAAPAVLARRSGAGTAAAVCMLAGLAAAGALLARRTISKRRRRPVAAGPGAPQPARREAGEGPFAYLAAAELDEVLGLVRGEHPQAIALVLAHLRPAKAAAVLAGLDPDQQVEVSRRLAGVDAMDEEVVREIEAALASRLSEAAPGRAGGLGDMDTIAEILNHAGHETEQAVLDGLDTAAPALADSLRKRTFVFEDIGKFPSGRLREALATLDSEDIALALRTMDKTLTRKVLGSLPASGARKVRREMDRIGPVRLMDVEAAQQRLVEAMRRVGAPAGPAADGSGSAASA